MPLDLPLVWSALPTELCVRELPLLRQESNLPILSATPIKASLRETHTCISHRVIIAWPATFTALLPPQQFASIRALPMAVLSSLEVVSSSGINFQPRHTILRTFKKVKSYFCEAISPLECVG